MYAIILTGAFGETETRIIRTRHVLRAYAYAVQLLAEFGWVGYRVRRVN